MGTARRWIVAACAVLTVLHPRAGATQARPSGVLQLGIGAMSCRYWLSTVQLEGEGNAWLLGYWTARNVANAGDHEVGSHTDGNGILTRLRKSCRDHPMAQIEDTANALYLRMAHDRRPVR